MVLQAKTDNDSGGAETSLAFLINSSFQAHYEAKTMIWQEISDKKQMEIILSLLEKWI